MDEFQDTLIIYLETLKKEGEKHVLASLDYKFMIEAQKQILGGIQGFISPRLKHNIQEKLALGDVTLFRLFSEFNQGMLHECELISELYKNFEGFEEVLRYKSFFTIQDSAAIEKMNLTEAERQLAQEMLMWADGSTSPRAILTNNIDSLTGVHSLIEILGPHSRRRTSEGRSNPN